MYYPVDDKTGKKVWFRPPGWVFGIVWPILLTLTGYSWFLTPEKTQYYTILTILLSSWSMLFSFNKVYSLINILLTLTTTLYLIIPHYKRKSSLLLLPLALWLCFASVLNYYSL
jgi:tryptophan-rich sensory protein